MRSSEVFFHLKIYFKTKESKIPSNGERHLSVAMRHLVISRLFFQSALRPEKAHNFGHFSPIWMFETNLKRTDHCKQIFIYVMRLSKGFFNVKIDLKPKRQKFRQMAKVASASPCVTSSFHDFSQKRRQLLPILLHISLN